jgi:hypothetical protein
MKMRIYDDIAIPANLTSNWRDVPVPQGNWRVVSLVALASVATNTVGVPGGVVTSDVETVIALNEADRLTATEEGAIEPIISGGVMLRATASKKISLGDVYVRVIITLEQA